MKWHQIALDLLLCSFCESVCNAREDAIRSPPSCTGESACHMLDGPDRRIPLSRRSKK